MPSHKNLSSSKVIDSVSSGKRLLLASQSAALGTKKEGKGLWYNEQCILRLCITAPRHYHRIPWARASRVRGADIARRLRLRAPCVTLRGHGPMVRRKKGPKETKMGHLLRARHVAAR